MTQTTTATDTTPRWNLDASHSSLAFSVRHMMITNVRGEFQKISGTVLFDSKNPSSAKIDVSIDAGSINTREEKRDGHLKSADFFDVEKYPTITFVSERIAKKGEGYEAIGDLTIRGTTKEVTLAIEDVTAEHTDPWGGRRIGASAKAKVKRSDFGMTWNAAIEAGGVLVGDEITITADVSLVKA
jgi:polyisoprenoid-binding protein YceI